MKHPAAQSAFSEMTSLHRMTQQRCRAGMTSRCHQMKKQAPLAGGRSVGVLSVPRISKPTMRLEIAAPSACQQAVDRSIFCELLCQPSRQKYQLMNFNLVYVD